MGFWFLMSVTNDGSLKAVEAPYNTQTDPKSSSEIVLALHLAVTVSTPTQTALISLLGVPCQTKKKK